MLLTRSAKPVSTSPLLKTLPAAASICSRRKEHNHLRPGSQQPHLRRSSAPRRLMGHLSAGFSSARANPKPQNPWSPLRGALPHAESADHLGQVDEALGLERRSPHRLYLRQPGPHRQRHAGRSRSYSRQHRAPQGRRRQSQSAPRRRQYPGPSHLVPRASLRRQRLGHLPH